jgi:hypothetical protein
MPRAKSMVSKEDTVIMRIALAYNEIQRREMIDRLPDVLRGTAIPDHVLEHERLVSEKRSAKTGEKATKKSGAEVYADSENMLTRLRKGILSAYPDEYDTRIANYGPLGVGAGPDENVGRLEALAEKVVAPLASGEISLVPDLQPEAIHAQVARHKAVPKGKGTATKDRQVKTRSLQSARKTSREMLQRIKNWVKSFYSAAELTSFGFDIPLPATRPRLRGVEPDATTPPAPPAVG